MRAWASLRESERKNEQTSEQTHQSLMKTRKFTNYLKELAVLLVPDQIILTVVVD